MEARSEAPRRAARLGRSQLLAALCLVAVANGVTVQIVQEVMASGFWRALGGSFNVSVVILAATALGFQLAWTSRKEDPSRVDIALAGVACLLILLPHRVGSWMAVALLGFHLLTRSNPSAATIPAALLFILVSTSAFWSDIATQLFATPVLSWDAALGTKVVQLFGSVATHRGNLIIAEGQAPLVILPGCSSLLVASYAVLCWATITYALRPVVRWGDLAGMTAIAALAALSNGMRLALMTLGETAYKWVHGFIGTSVFNVSVLVCTAALAFRMAGVPQSHR